MNGKARPYANYLVAFVVGLIIFLLTSYRVFGGGTLDEWMESFNATPGAGGILFVNALVGISVALFVAQLKWNALRVTLTVVAALIFGYFVTGLFNLDTANKYVQGEFIVALQSDAEPVDQDDIDLQYGRQRGGELNNPEASDPLTEARFTFAGNEGDVITILAAVANRRSEVDLEVALLSPDGEALASSTSSTPEQLEAFEDLRSEKDATIADFTLPTTGVYTISAEAEPLSTGTIISEAVKATNAAYEAFLLGPLGRPNRWAVWIQDALTLILVGLSIAIVFRARQFSLGAEGQLYFGALVSGAICLAWTNLPPLLVVPIALLASMTAGFLWGLLPGVLKAYLGANELVSTLMLNAVAVRFYELVLTFQIKPPTAGYTASAPFPEGNILAPIIPDTQVTIAVFIVIGAVIASWLLISRTPLGYEIRMVGSNRKFADYGGINSKRVIMLSMAVSGILAGLAGAHLAMGIHRMLILNISLGLAFEGVVVALLARNNPLVIPFTGLLYAYMRAGAQFMERDANVSFEVVRIIQAVIILLITAEALATMFRFRRARNVTTTLDQGLETTAAIEGKAHV
ncbi:MAG: ABC transporter permease [Anaerolineae bacterium]|nr:ABC transporter permease [Anaerolineae bacterium]